MTESPLSPPDREGRADEIDISTAHAVRVYDYLLGGTVNFAADREAAALVSSAFSEGERSVRASMRENRAFLGRAVRYLIDAGTRQFLDIGTGIPREASVQGIAQQAAPESRIVSVSNDPIVLAHAHELLQGTAEGASSYIQANSRDTRTILGKAAETLDFTQPVGLMLAGVLHFIADDEDPYGIVSTLLEAVPAGSHLVISHLASDIEPEQMAKAVERINQVGEETFFLRSHAEVSKFFDGLELVEPGVVPVHRWRQDPPDALNIAIHCGVGRKP